MTVPSEIEAAILSCARAADPTKKIRAFANLREQIERALSGPAKVLDDRHVLCPVCRQVRGCSHLAAELEHLRARVAQVTSDGERNAAAIQASLERAEETIQTLRDHLAKSEADLAAAELKIPHP
jgi:multidrug resistance efflux pump